jgi:hypothetical protein
LKNVYGFALREQRKNAGERRFRHSAVSLPCRR